MSEEVSTKESSLSLKYVKILKVFLMSMALWPGKVLEGKESLFEKVFRFYGACHVWVPTAGTAYLYKNFNDVDFFTMGHLYITIFLAILTWFRFMLSLFKRYHLLSERFFQKFHLIHFKNTSEYNLKINNKIDELSYYFTLYQMVMMMSGMVLFNIAPMYHNYKIGAFTGNRVENSSLEFSLYLVVPGFDQEEMFLSATILNFYLSLMCAVAVCAIDLYLMLMVFQIIGHVLILKHNLLSIPGPKVSKSIQVKNVQVPVEMNDAEENELAHNSLVDCIEHHKLIVSFTDEISGVFGPALASTYLFHLVGCCLLLLECSTGNPDAISRYGILTVIIFSQLIQISVIFEVVGAASEKLCEAVYFVPWECMDTRNRRAVLLLLQRVQTPIRVTAMGLVDVGVTTMTGILKTTYTYFTFLTSMRD